MYLTLKKNYLAPSTKVLSMAVAVAVAVSGAVAVPVAGLTKRFLIKKIS